MIVDIKKISILITIRNLDINRYNISEYIYIPIYFLEEKGTGLIFYKIYIMNNLNAKVLIKIDIIKSKGIILNL